MVSLFRLRFGVTVLIILSGVFSSYPVLAGSILKVSCPCGFKMERIFAGGGKQNFKTICKVPAYCGACDKMEILNWLEKDPQCIACGGKVVFYNDPSLQKDKLDSNKDSKDIKKVFFWNASPKGVFILPDTTYLCPQCGNMTLRFIGVGRWD